MEDRELDILLRLAIEADELVRADSEPVRSADHRPRYVAPPIGATAATTQPRRRTLVRRGLWSAAALSAAAALLWAMWPHGTPSSRDLVRGHRVEVVSSGTPRGHAAVGPSEECVVLAIFRESDGDCQCRAISPMDLGAGSSLDSIDPREFLRIALNASCSAEPEQVVVLAVAGPRKDLPDDADEADMIVACLDESALLAGADADGSSYAMAVRDCLPSGVSVVSRMFDLSMP
ncbi:MAG: hypothetical protein HUU22_03645 [Phycisphaerae bacterium]|nr:hypothetical protein [Phycisphaerae bacterium]NUQ45109.1 hypothetical protein [Phycisphaerae bacterium]